MRPISISSQLSAQWAKEKPPGGVEPRFELGPALQQATLHPYWATLHPIKPRCTLLSHAAPYWATLHPTEPRCTLLSHAAPYWATLHPTTTFFPAENFINWKLCCCFSIPCILLLAAELPGWPRSSSIQVRYLNIVKMTTWFRKLQTKS